MARHESSEALVPVSEKILDPPENGAEFKFPFNPYPIQVDFMKALFTALEQRKLGIFESPTGTGKSLSLLCGSLTWLEHREEARLSYLEKVINSIDMVKEEQNAKDSSIDWIQAQYDLRRKKEIINTCKRELSFLETLRNKRQKYLSKKTAPFSLSSNDKQHKSLKQKSEQKDTDEAKKKNVNSKEDLQNEIDELVLSDEFVLEAYSDSEGEDMEQDEEPEFYPTRIIFASRTHSQLGQFANELKRTDFATKVTSCSLGSRQNLCINPDVMKLKNLSMMNERCLEIQKGSKGKKTSDTKKMKSCNGCDFFSHSKVEELKNEILSTPMDIEELVSAGNRLNACPYYASRKASKEAQLVMLPYNSILHKSTREGIGLKTNNSVLLLDEAHNIIESISNMYSISVTLSQLESCSAGLNSYISRFKTRFSVTTFLHLKQINFILKSMQKALGEPNKNIVYNIQEFKMMASMEHLDLHSLMKFINKSKLAFKIKGYMMQKQSIEVKTAELNGVDHSTKQNQAIPSKSGHPSLSRFPNKNNMKSGAENRDPINKTGVPTRLVASGAGQAIFSFIEFLKSLLTSFSGGRVIREDKTFKFLLLSSSDHFSDLLSSTRSIILAGGTMKPYDEVEDQLFQPVKERIYHFSCDHVIPDDNLICIGLNRGPTSTLLDFTYQQRKTSQIVEELTRTILNLSKIVPGGLVCFLPSYDYEATLYSFLNQSGNLEKIEKNKKVFREPKDSSCDVVLANYSRQIKNSSNGAILFAVVGGKLSEGINFSDGLGRCVLVVGLPFPNVTSVEIKEKVQYISDFFGKEKSTMHLSNMCSKAVNQSIGRAIRHSQDYAAIVLVDHRYSRLNQQELLPNWIRKRFQVCDQFGPAVGAIAKFFASKKPK